MRNRIEDEFEGGVDYDRIDILSLNDITLSVQTKNYWQRYLKFIFVF